jgi:hypothetical protein
MYIALAERYASPDGASSRRTVKAMVRLPLSGYFISFCLSYA